MPDSSVNVDVAIIGAGTAGLTALREVKRAGKSFVLIDRGPLGTTCARVGCMPSKAALHAGSIWQGHASMRSSGRAAGVSPDTLWDDARKMRDMLAAGAAKRTVSAAGDRLMMGHARFVSADSVEVDGKRVTASAFVVAAGSRPVVPPSFDEIRDRLFTTDSLFERGTLPRSIGIVGMGAIGVEIGLALSRLGVHVIGGDLKDTLAGITDPEIGVRALDQFRKEMTIWLGQPIKVGRQDSLVTISNGTQTWPVEWLLAAIGRRPSVGELDLPQAGVQLDQNGLPQIDPDTMRAGNSSLYFAGDISPDRPLMHEAADEGAIAGWNAAHHDSPVAFRRRVPLAIVFSDPDIASVGTSFDQLDPDQTVIGSASGESNGRARIMGAEHSFIRIYAAKGDGRLLGASILGTRGEHLAHLLAWAIQRGETAESLLEMPFYHPTIEEVVQSALFDIVKKQTTTRAGITGLRAIE